jgi:hypothetical protein
MALEVNFSKRFTGLGAMILALEGRLTRLFNRPHGPPPANYPSYESERYVYHNHEGGGPKSSDNRPLLVVAVGIFGIILSIVGSAWKLSNDLSQFRGEMLQWQIDTEKNITRMQQEIDRLLRPPPRP